MPRKAPSKATKKRIVKSRTFSSKKQKNKFKPIKPKRKTENV